MGTQIGSRGGTFHSIEFRRNDRDRQPPSEVVTGRLMGDPDPNREARSAKLLEDLASVASKPGTGPRHHAPTKGNRGKRAGRTKRDDMADA